MSRVSSSAILVLIAGLGTALAPRPAQAVFASPVNGGCYITAPGQCRIHIDPVTISIGSGKRLELIVVQLNGKTIYDYRTDVSNPPPNVGSTYTFSPVGLDFGALCGKRYSVNVLAKDTGDTNPLNVGATDEFTCPDRKALKPD